MWKGLISPDGKTEVTAAYVDTKGLKEGDLVVMADKKKWRYTERNDWCVIGLKFNCDCSYCKPQGERYKPLDNSQTSVVE